METKRKSQKLLASLYLICSVLGIIVPWYFNLRQALYGEEPFNLQNYFSAGFANNFVASISSDFFIGTTPILVWMIVEGKRLRMKGIWLYFFGTFAISFAFTCPLFFYNRMKKINDA